MGLFRLEWWKVKSKNIPGYVRRSIKRHAKGKRLFSRSTEYASPKWDGTMNLEE